MKQGTKPKVILMYGGCSGEHEISLLSAASVLSALDSTRYHIECISGDKQGRWYLTPIAALKSQDKGAALPVKTKDSQEITLAREHFDGAYAVLPIMHGTLFEDGCLQGFLTLIDIPFIGSGHLASAMAMDKEVTKIMAISKNIAVAPYVALADSTSEKEQQQQVQQAVSQFGFPLFVKPACLGSSVGTHLVKDLSSLQAALKDAFRFDHKVLIEKAIKGRELEVAILKEHNQVVASVAGEISMKSDSDFYSYQAKYQDKEAAILHLPAMLTASQLAEIQRLAILIFQCLACEGLARVDFFLEEGTSQLILNEVNTLPGFTEISMYPKLWQLSGVSYADLLDKLIQQANWRHQQSKKLLRDYS